MDKDTLENIKKLLISQDPTLESLFKIVGDIDFKSLKKPVYCALIGAIIGQKISYQKAKDIRGKLFKRLGTGFSVDDIDKLLQNNSNKSENYVPLDVGVISTIKNLNTYLRENNMDSKEYQWSVDDIEKLEEKVNGIGSWTIQNTLLVSMKSMNVFPMLDTFITNRMKKLYGISNMTVSKKKEIIERWNPYKGIVAWYFWRWF